MLQPRRLKVKQDVNIRIMLLWAKGGQRHILLGTHHIHHALNLLPDALLKILITLVIYVISVFHRSINQVFTLLGHNTEWYSRNNASGQPTGC